MKLTLDYLKEKFNDMDGGKPSIGLFICFLIMLPILAYTYFFDNPDKRLSYDEKRYREYLEREKKVRELTPDEKKAMEAFECL